MKSTTSLNTSERGASRPAAATQQAAAINIFRRPAAVERAAGRDVPRSGSSVTLVLLSLSFALTTALAQDKVTYQDHVLPLIEANCAKCHNADKKKADLDLTSYQAALQGSGSGPVLVSGNPDASKLWKA